MNLIAQFVGYFFIGCIFLGLVLIACANRKTKDGSAKGLTDASRPGEAHGCYVEDDRTRQLRTAYVARHDGTLNKRAIAHLIETVGRN